MIISPITKEFFLVLFGDNNILEGLTIKIQAFRNVRTQEFRSKVKYKRSLNSTTRLSLSYKYP